MHGPRQGINRLFALQNEHIHFVSGQNIGKRRTGRTQTDNHHLMMGALGNI